MKLTEEMIESIIEAAHDLVPDHIHDDWEGENEACFDPFGDYKKELKLKLEELNAPKPRE